MSSIILVLYYLLMCFRASLSHVYRAARSSKRAGSIFSSVYIGTAARLTPFLVFRSQQRLCLLCDYLRYTVVALNRRFLVAAATAGSLNDWLSFTRQCVPPARVWWDSCLLERIVRSLIVWKKIKTSTDLMRLMCIMVWLYSFCHLSVVFCGFVNLLWLVGRSCDNQKISVCKKKECT